MSTEAMRRIFLLQRFEGVSRLDQEVFQQPEGFSSYQEFFKTSSGGFFIQKIFLLNKDCVSPQVGVFQSRNNFKSDKDSQAANSGGFFIQKDFPPKQGLCFSPEIGVFQSKGYFPTIKDFPATRIIQAQEVF